MLWVQWWFLIRITCKHWHRISNILSCVTNIILKLYLEKHGMSWRAESWRAALSCDGCDPFQREQMMSLPASGLCKGTSSGCAQWKPSQMSPLSVPRAPLSADGAYWSTAEDVTFALQIRLHGRTLTVWWGQENQFNSTCEQLHLKHSWRGPISVSKVNGKNRWSV